MKLQKKYEIVIIKIYIFDLHFILQFISIYKYYYIVKKYIMTKIEFVITFYIRISYFLFFFHIA